MVYLVIVYLWYRVFSFYIEVLTTGAQYAPSRSTLISI